MILALASVAASTVATLLALRVPHPQALPAMMITLTVFIIIFCELAPKIYAAMHSESVALNSTLVYRAAAVDHLAAALVHQPGRLRSSCAVRRCATARTARSALGAEELRTVVSESSALMPARHRQMLLSILDLERVTVNDIMIPRQDIAGIDISADWEDVLERLRQTPHTRLPVYDGELDNLIGILHMKRTAQEFARGTLTRERLIELAQAREPYFVPEGTSLMQQLAQFQRNRRRHAFVVNEYGDIAGLVTLEDMLEEIVGEFTTDPATVGHKDVHRDASGAWLVNGERDDPRAEPLARLAAAGPRARRRSTVCCSRNWRTSRNRARRCASASWNSRCCRPSTTRSAPCACARSLKPQTSTGTEGARR